MAETAWIGITRTAKAAKSFVEGAMAEMTVMENRNTSKMKWKSLPLVIASLANNPNLTRILPTF